MRIPVHFGQVFRSNSDTRSDSIRTVIPIQFGHLFRFNSDSDSGMNSDSFWIGPEWVSGMLRNGCPDWTGTG